MSVKVTLEYASLEEAITALAKLRTSDAAAPAPKPVKTDKPAATPSGATQAGAPATSDTAAADKAAADTAALYEKVKAAITAATKDSANVPKVKGVLATFHGAKTGKDLKAEDYEPFLTALATALAAEDLS